MKNTVPTFGGVGWGGYMQTFNVGPQTLPNYPNSKQVARSAEFKYNAAAADPNIPGASILNVRDVVSIPFNPLFNPMIIEDNDIKVASGKTDKVASKTQLAAAAEKKRVVERAPVKKAVIGKKPVAKGAKDDKAKAKANQRGVGIGVEATFKSASGLNWNLIAEVKAMKKPHSVVTEVSFGM